MWVQYQRRLDIATCDVDASTVHDGLARQELFESCGMALAGDAAIIGALRCVLAIELAQACAHLHDELIGNAPVHIHMIGRYTGLPRIHELAPRDARHRNFEVSTGVDQAGTL